MIQGTAIINWAAAKYFLIHRLYILHQLDGIEIKNVDGYIDHQSIDTIDNLMKEYNCTIEEFIFDKGITLVIDNDN